MSVAIFIPTALRGFTEGKSEVSVEGANVEEALNNLNSLYPAIQQYLFDKEGNLKRFINIFVDESNIKNLDGIKTALKDGSRISLIPAIAGGSNV